MRETQIKILKFKRNPVQNFEFQENASGKKKTGKSKITWHWELYKESRLRTQQGDQGTHWIDQMWHELCVEHWWANRYPCDERLRWIRLAVLLCKRPWTSAEQPRRMQQLRDCSVVLLLLLVLLFSSHHNLLPLSPLPSLSCLSLSLLEFLSLNWWEGNESSGFESGSLFLCLMCCLLHSRR